MTDPISPTQRPRPVATGATRPQTDAAVRPPPGADAARPESARPESGRPESGRPESARQESARRPDPHESPERQGGRAPNRDAGEQGAREQGAGGRRAPPPPTAPARTDGTLGEAAKTANAAHRATAAPTAAASTATTQAERAMAAQTRTATPPRAGVGAVLAGLAKSVDIPATVAAQDGDGHIVLRTADAYLRLPIPPTSQTNPPKPGESLLVTLRADTTSKTPGAMTASLTRAQTPPPSPDTTMPRAAAAVTSRPETAAQNAQTQAILPGPVKALPVPPPNSTPPAATPTTASGTASPAAAFATAPRTGAMPSASTLETRPFETRPLATGAPPIRPGVTVEAVLTVREHRGSAPLSSPLAKLTAPDALGSRVRLSVLTVTPPPPDALARASAATTTPAGERHAHAQAQTTMRAGDEAPRQTPPIAGDRPALTPSASGLAERTAQMIRVGIDVAPRPGAHSPADGQRGPVSTAPVITGTVSGRDGAGNTLLKTAVGALSMVLPRPLAPGTELMLAVDDVLPPSDVDSPSPSASPQAAAGAPDGDPLDALALVRRFERGWPALDEAIKAIAAQSPAAVDRLVAQIAPAPGPKMTAVLFAFLAALKGGDVRQWLGREVVETLETAGQGDVLKRLGDDFSQLARLPQQTAQGEWRAYIAPFLSEGEIKPLKLFVAKDGGNDGGATGEDDTGARFVIELALTGLGALQLDGRVFQRRFDLILRSHKGLPATMRADIGDIFRETMEITGMGGALAFQVTPDFPVAPEQSLAPSMTGGMLA